ncbi:hypothetical protein IMSAGC006_02164 [Muribaculaceae bacterium]|nr:hypothetical protein IMSAGC006_02164 [Muribaculaceae bacterium]
MSRAQAIFPVSLPPDMGRSRTPRVIHPPLNPRFISLQGCNRRPLKKIFTLKKY